MKFARSDKGGLKGHIEKSHQNGKLLALRPELIFRRSEVFLFRVRHTDRGSGESCGFLLLINAGGFGHVLLLCPPDDVRMLFGCVLISAAATNKVVSRRGTFVLSPVHHRSPCAFQTPKLSCDYAACLKVDEVFRDLQVNEAQSKDRDSVGASGVYIFCRSLNLCVRQSKQRLQH